MTLQVSNTLTGEREAFEPRDPEDVLLYVCGLTCSDPPHLGHARLWTHADVFHRWLEFTGYQVNHVENITDVNEKIVARAGREELGEDEAAVAHTYLEQALRDMRSLNLLRARVYPRVTEHIPEIVELIGTLVDEGYAYESGGSVYFDVTSYPDYGALSNQRVEEIEAQGEASELAEKRHPADFALWKAGPVDPESIAEHRGDDHPHADDVEPGGQTWPSPWGEGRPGWHIECSAMSMTHLGETLDIHVGGQDLVFPHHENEIAQSEAATGQPFANYWLHVRLLETDEEKMSSSLGNFTTVASAVESHGADAVRMFLLSTNYANRQTLSARTMEEAVERWERLERGYERAVEAADGPDAHTKVEAAALREQAETTAGAVETAMDDDFNTREAIAALLELASAVHRHVDAADEFDYQGLRAAIETFETYGGTVLGFRLGDGDDADVELASDLVRLVLEVREAEREAGNYERADQLRAELDALGVTIEDSDDGPEIRLP